jgi:hypothetical protein
VRVAPDSICGFVHGKAGVIELADGRKLGFIGSMNETRSGWQRHYEILWEDESPEGRGLDRGASSTFCGTPRDPLPQAVIREVHRRGYRREVVFDEIEDDENVAPAALIESPLYREGLALQPWQQGFRDRVPAPPPDARHGAPAAGRRGGPGQDAVARHRGADAVPAWPTASSKPAGRW